MRAVLPSWVLLAVLACAPAHAQAIGDATTVVRDVRGVIAGRIAPLAAGDTVYRDQIVRTLADSSAVVTFLDKTGMAIGPLSEVQLDEFVFPSKGGPRTVDAVKGFFRFISGPGAAGHDYKVRTPHATIAVRGTTFDVRVTDAQTTVVLHEGAVDVCSAGTCRALHPGETVDALRTEVKAPRPRGPSDWTFATPARREQRAALEKAEAILRSSSAANHAAYERRLAAAARPEQQAAARLVPVPLPAPLPAPVPATAPAPDPSPAPAPPPREPAAAPGQQAAPASAVLPATVPEARAIVPAALPPVTGPTLPGSGPGSPPALAEGTRPATPVAVPGAPAHAPGRDADAPPPTTGAPAASRRPAFALPTGSLIADRPAPRAVVTTGGSSRLVDARASRSHDQAILVLAEPQADVQPGSDSLPGALLRRAQARDGPPMRPG